MRKAFQIFVAAAGSLAALVAISSVGEARERARPLTVHKRSFLDAGKVVPVGTKRNYVNDATLFNLTPDQVNQRAKFGNETLPGLFELPGFRR